MSALNLNIFKRKKHVTLVLGGGSARGIAHIGALAVLERERIPIHRIIGTSIGAFVGAGYSLGISTREMEEMATAFTWKNLFDPVMPKMGLLAGDKLEKVIRDLTDSRSFRDCKIPLYVVTTNIETGEEVVLKSGDLQKAIRASCSWPGIFAPVKIDGRLLVDGGVKNSVPTKFALDGETDYIIAVDVGFCVKHGKIDNIFQMILQSFQVMGHELNKWQSREADTVIEVDLGDLDQAAFDRAREAIREGFQAAEAKIGKIKKDLGI
jgi:NTE family protein